MNWPVYACLGLALLLALGWIAWELALAESEETREAERRSWREKFRGGCGCWRPRK